MQVLHHYGVVAILDALGISNLSALDGVKFIEARDKAIDRTNKRAERNTQLIQALEKFNDKHQFDKVIKSVNPFPKVLSVNDTVIFSWPIELDSEDELDNELVSYTLKFVSDFLAYFLAISLSIYGYKYRGAMSINDYAEIEDNSIIGRAVSDAASLYSRHDHVGVVVTPNSTALIDRIVEGNAYYSELISGNFEDELALMKTRIRLKNSQVLPLWTVPWPAAFARFYRVINDAKNESRNPRQSFIALLWADDPPLQAQQKCFEALDYYDLCQSYLRTLRKSDG